MSELPVDQPQDNITPSPGGKTDKPTSETGQSTTDSQPDSVEQSWPLFRQVVYERPQELPEPINPDQPPPTYDQQPTAFLPPLPEPHADILWPVAHNTLLKPAETEAIDLLAHEKNELRYKQPLDYRAEPTEPSSWKTFTAFAREAGETILMTIVIFFLIQMVVRNFRVVGTSMVNNLHDGQYLIIDKVTYNPLLTDIVGIGGIQRGDVIVFEPPNRPEDDYVKRVIGLPGETVEVRYGEVYINNERLPEPFRPQTGSYNMPPVVVGPREVFVLGDNRNNSNDSHNWGTLPIENIVGRAWISYWPPDEWGYIPRDRPTEQATLKYFLEGLIPRANAEENELPHN